MNDCNPSHARRPNERVAAPGPSLEQRLDALKLDAGGLDRWIDELETRHAAVEDRILAFLPEPGRFARLRREARALVERFPDPAARPCLFGLPIGVKDVFHVAGFKTHAGSKLPADKLTGPQAEVVTRLLNAGALVLGKVACTELAYFGPGPTRNPHAPDHTPGGSSSGSAAAIAAGTAPITLGTQTIGSVGRPAAFCGVVGFKPSYDRVPRAGLVPLASSVDHVGWFAPTARDAALVARVLLTEAAPRLDLDLPDGEKPNGAPVLAVAAGPYLDHAAPAGKERFAAACEHLRRAGLRLVEAELPVEIERVARLHRRLVAAEAFQAHGAWLDTHREALHPKTVTLLEDGRAVSDAVLGEARASRLAVRRVLEDGLRTLGADLWLSPAAPGPAPEGLSSTGDPIMNLPWTHAGLPTLVLPDRTPGTLPTGLQIAGSFGADLSVLAWGERLEALLERHPAQPGSSETSP